MEDKLSKANITVSQLKPSEQFEIVGMTPELSGYDEIRNDKGELVQVPQRLPLLIAASVSMIDDWHIPFPRNREELNAIFDRLGADGIAAAGKAYLELIDDDDDDDRT